MTQNLQSDDGMSAVLSECGTYRYRLTRRIGGGGTRGTLVFDMLNPSKADAELNDPTVRKCLGFGQRWGFGQLVVVNMFGIRSTDPREVRAARCRGVDVVGPENHRYVREAVAEADLFVCAWGRNVERWDWAKREMAFVGMFTKQMHSLGLTKGGNPRHPLMVSYDTELLDYMSPWGLMPGDPYLKEALSGKDS